MRDIWKRIVAVDVRSLALMRIGFGILLLRDVWVRSSILEAHYTYRGIMPGWLSINFDNYQHSLYWMNDSIVWAGFLLFMLGVSGLFLALGLCTKTASLCSWGFLVSLHARMPHSLNSGDTLMSLLLLIGFFVPWNACWSIDAMLDRSDFLARSAKVPIPEPNAGSVPIQLEDCESIPKSKSIFSLATF